MKEITIKVKQTSNLNNPSKSAYVATIEGEQFKGIVAMGDNIHEALTELCKSIKALELYLRNTASV